MRLSMHCRVLKIEKQNTILRYRQVDITTGLLRAEHKRFRIVC